VLAGAFVDPPARNWIWLAAIGADLLAAGSGAGGDGRDWDIRPAHFSERHGLFVIIALGESLIVAATAVSAQERTWELMSDVIAALVIVCLLWWTYFGWLKEAAEEGLAAAPSTKIGPLARDAFSLGHFPLVCGIVAFSVAVEEIVHHPAHAPSGAIVAALGVGVTLFVGSSAFAYWRTSGHVLMPRLVILAITMAALALVSSSEPIWLLVVVAVGLLAIATIEARLGLGARSHDDQESGIPPSDG
jgi:low temperature requirement protein LtrA